MESLSLLQCGSTTFRDRETATLVGYGADQSAERPAITLRRMFDASGCMLLHDSHVIGKVLGFHINSSLVI